MTHMEVINKLAGEMSRMTGEIEHINTYRWFIRQALDIGINHFTKNMEEIVVLTIKGVERGRFKGVSAAAKSLGLDENNIHHVLAGRRHSTGGFVFIRAKDRLLVPRTKVLLCENDVK